MGISLQHSKTVETDRAAIEAELKRLLNEKRFAGAPMMSAFLRYIVTQKLEGNAARIKAYTIGVDALGKPDSFDAQLDPSVRVLALRLRKTLKATYESGAASAVRIELRVGTYVPEFYKASSSDTQTEAKTAKPIVDVVSDVGTFHRDSEQLASDTRLQSTQLAKYTALVAERQQTYGSSKKGSHPVISRANTARQGLFDRNMPLARLSMLCVLVLLTLALLRTAPFNGHEILFGATNSESSIQVASLGKQGNAPGVESQDTTPTLFVRSEVQPSSRLYHVSVRLGRSVMKAGDVNVVFMLDSENAIKTSKNDYTMLLSEVMVGTKARIDTQILRTTTGRMISNATLLFDESIASFSGEEIDHIERLATSISNVDGPLYQDFCKKQAAPTPDYCKAAQLPPGDDAPDWPPLRHTRHSNDV